MGLDMYLYANRWFSRYGHASPEDAEVNPVMDAILAAAKLEKIVIPLDENYQSVEVKVQAAYWRKANQIHKWFVDHVQDGKDDCGTYDVDEEKLRELRATCQHAIDTGDASLLPPQSGFFFGNTDIDDYYWDDLRNTIRQIDRIILADPPKGKGLDSVTFQYRSSW